MIQLITGFVWNYSTDFKISIYGKHKLQSKIELNSQEQWLSEVQTKKHIRYKSMFDIREYVGETGWSGIFKLTFKYSSSLHVN